MVFNSIDFAFFIIPVFIGYWFVFNKNLRLQNMFLLAGSYFFYAFWDWRFLFLLLFSTLLDYYTGKIIYTSGSTRHKKTWLYISIVCNLGFLFLFKYYNFFIESFIGAFTFFGYSFSGPLLSIVLPVGISFYTFHGLSYVIDIYKERTKPAHDFAAYALFVSYFPLLVAGPIERATHLLPQIQRPRTFNIALASEGLRQLLWGLFKKMVIADNCAMYVNRVFDNPSAFNGSSLALGAVFFSFQIYCDFSGYTDMASGVSKLFGIRLLRNFNYPYFSRNIAEFWRRWHISLSSWFKDYVYIPLGGSKGSIAQSIRNVFIIFLLSGFWHGAKFTFIIWGAVHALLFIPLLLAKQNRNDAHSVPQIKNALGIITTFIVVTLAWIFFRANSMADALAYFQGMFTSSILEMPDFFPKKLLCIMAGFMVVEWLGRRHEFAIAAVHSSKFAVVRYGVYYMLVILIFYFMGNEENFIYFQF